MLWSRPIAKEPLAQLAPRLYRNLPAFAIIIIEADFLREGIHELRAQTGRVHYQMLYFFYGRNVAVLDHALTKEGKVPDADIERAIRRKKAFERDPARHTYEEELSNG